MTVEALIINGDAELALGTDIVKQHRIQMILTDPLYNYAFWERNAFHAQFLNVAVGTVVVFCPPENAWQDKPSQRLFWTKPVSTKNTSKTYSRFVEEIQLFELASHKHYGDRLHWSNYTNILTDKVDSKVHQWRKPPSMIQRFIQIHTDEGDWVLDPFAGSGVVAECALQLKRNVVIIEKEIELCDQTFDTLKFLAPWANLSLKVVG